jgi:hypothetical protein
MCLLTSFVVLETVNHNDDDVSTCMSSVFDMYRVVVVGIEWESCDL